MLSGEGSNSFATDKPMVVRFGIKLEYRNVHMYKGIKAEKPEKKVPVTKTGTTLNPHMNLSPEFKLGPHYWKASASINVPSL